MYSFYFIFCLSKTVLNHQRKVETMGKKKMLDWNKIFCPSGETGAQKYFLYITWNIIWELAKRKKKEVKSIILVGVGMKRDSLNTSCILKGLFEEGVWLRKCKRITYVNFKFTLLCVWRCVFVCVYCCS